jgi:transcriptional regulator with XRE-family HTH domain
MATFSERVRDLRMSMNLSLRQLSKVTGLSHSAICKYEQGTREPTFESLEALADVFNCDIDYLLGRSDIKCALLHGTGYNSLYDAYKDGFDLQLFAENKSPANEYDLTDREKKLIDLFRKVPVEKQEETLARIEFALLTLR